MPGSATIALGAGIGRQASRRGPTTLPAQNYVRFTRSAVSYLVKNTGTPVLTGATATNLCTISFWLDMKENDGAGHFIFRGDNGSTGARGIVIARTVSNIISVVLYDAGDAVVITVNTAATHTTATGKKHYYFAIDTQAQTASVYINGVADSATVTPSSTNACDLSRPSRFTFGSGDSPSTTISLGAEVSDFVIYQATVALPNFYSSGWVPLPAGGNIGGVTPVVAFGLTSRANSDTSSDSAKGWQDGYNHAGTGAFTSGGAAIVNAPGKVRFDSSSNAYLERTGGAITGQPTAGMNSFLAVARVFYIPAYRQIMLKGLYTTGGGTNFNFTFGATGRLACSGANSSGTPQFGIGASVSDANGDIMPSREPLLIACSGRSTTGGGQALQLYYYRYSTGTWYQNSASVVTLPVNNAEMTADDWMIGDPAGNYKLNSELSYLALDMATTGAAYLDLSNSSNRAALLGAPTAWNGGRTPTLLFGISPDGATNYQASGWTTNRGAGGETFTLTGSIADA